ncbi:MAG: rRNA pseudouridine synthase, partial [Victivallales bacterium]|nr:rRNA pseudouridine synthase [Victivallales bacterium]
MEKDDLTMENADAAPEKGMRLGKYLAMAGIGSRRSCEGYIQEGRVTVNGEAVTEPGTCVTEADDVRFEGKPISLADRTKVYLMLNKPVGFTCSARDVHAKNLVYQLIPERFGRIFTVGRLDRDSEGLLILTNDGEFAQRLTHPSHQIYKRYYVECGGRYTTSVRRKLMDGMYDNGEFLQALNVEQLSVQHGFCKLIFTMGEGRKREVRRLCKDVGLRVELLRRVGVGQLELDPQLTPGSWRIMSPRDCELALQPIAVPERPRSTEPPKPYWVKEEPEEMTARKPRAAGGREGVRRGRGGETEDGRRPGRKPARPRQPEAPERHRSW